ncbi:MAG: protein of unknown function [Nitrospira sp.]
MITLRHVLLLAMGWSFLLAPTFAQFRDPIEPYHAPDQDPKDVQERAVGGEAGTATTEQEPASPAMAPTMPDESAPASEATDIQERGILPGAVAPGAKLLPIPAPTPSLTAIRNAIKVTSKSISVNLRVPPNLPVTVPVEVEVFYSSPLKSQILKRTYSPATGLTLSYRDAEGNGQPRPMNVQITVRELVPNGQGTGFNKQVTITPLYDVFVTDLRFVMASKCDLVGKSDIGFLWYSPDGQFHEQTFKLGGDEARGITQFSWTRKEVAARDKLMEPSVQFREGDPFFYQLPQYSPTRFGPSAIPLVPGPTTKYDFFLKKEATGPPGLRGAFGGNSCVARITYTIIKALMPFDQF